MRMQQILRKQELMANGTTPFTLEEEMAALRQEIAELQSGMKQILSILTQPIKKLPPTEPLKKYTYTTEDLATAEIVLKTIQSNVKVNQPTMPSWANTIRLMIEVDKRTHAQIKALITAVSHDHFWSGVILSPQNLRKHWHRLHDLAVVSNCEESLDKYRKRS